MADVEMEVDGNRPISLDAQPDEDLIDFDTDMADQHEAEWTHAGEAQTSLHAHDKDAHSYEELILDDETTAYGGTSHDLDMEPDEDADDDLDVMEAGTDRNVQPMENDYPQANGDSLPSETRNMEEKSHVDDLDDASATYDAAGDDDQASTHEIDFELGDVPEEDAAAQEADRGITDDTLTTHTVENTAEEPEASISVNHVSLDYVPTTIEVTEITDSDVKEQQEITWDEEGSHEQGDGEGDGAGEQDSASYHADAQAGDQSYDLQETEVEDGAEGNNTSQEQVDDDESPSHLPEEQHEVSDHLGHGDYEEVEEAHGGEQQTADLGSDAQSAPHQDTAGETDVDFPAITVQYKGDEFPMFSSTTEGFFTEASILDDTMETLLAHFRQELESEIVHEDELVFQVDELGLEFAESSIRDSLSSVTLRQILEIFDLLVKNQDPDNSRTLYTYLFTRPSTVKRLEFLIESATAGKGLDEIIHLFESPMPNKANLVEASSTAQEFDENLDEYESPVDDATDLNEETLQHDTGDIGDGGDEVLDLSDDGSAQLDDGQDQTSIDNRSLDGEQKREGTTEADGHITDEATSPEDVNANGNTATPAPCTQSPCFRPHFCLCPNCTVDYAEEHDQKETRFQQAFDFRQVLGASDNDQKGSHDLRRGLFHQVYAHSDFSTTFSYQDADDFSQDLPESETNPFINLELDDNAELADEVDLVNHVAAKDDTIVETNLFDTNRANTSTTTTLRDEDDAASPEINLDAHLDTEETSTNNAAEDEDELAEIDWREEVEVSVDGSDSPSGTGKRARTDDDELGAEDEKDVKRRRP